MSISIAEAKAHLSDCIRQAEQGEPILNTRHGKPVAALVAASHLEHSSDFGGPGLRADWPVWLGDGSEELVHHHRTDASHPGTPRQAFGLK